MSFTSLFFVAIFFPVFMLIYYVIRDLKLKNVWLLAGSLLFYAFCGINNLILIVIMAVFAWFTGIMIQSARDRIEKAVPEYQAGDEEFMDPSAQINYEKNKRTAQFYLITGVVLLAAVLMVFKYSEMILNYLPSGYYDGGIKNGIIKMGLPLGISFYTFKLISYIADVYSGRTRAGRLFDVMLYTVIFHQVTQGPIVRFGLMASRFENRKITCEDVADGALRFSTGLAKKTLLADHCGKLSELFLPLSEGMSCSVFGAYIGSVCYMLQIYLDFSAYSDMALGLGKMIGFTYPENFNYPYMATSVRDFWRRWHISLSEFFRDYVYIPLGGRRVKFWRLLLNLFTVWILTGVWHGSSMNFILWGMYYFVFIVLENILHKYTKHKKTENKNNVLSGHLGRIYTLIVVFFGWVLFRITDLEMLVSVLKVMLGRSQAELFSTSEILSLRGNIYFLIFAVTVCTPLWKELEGGLSRKLHLSFMNERSENRKLKREHSLYEQEVKRDQVLMEKYGQHIDMLKDVKQQDEDNHVRMVGRIEDRLRRKKSERIQIETVYYGIRTFIMLVCLFIAILSMVGASYTPFLYNQF